MCTVLIYSFIKALTFIMLQRLLVLEKLCIMNLLRHQPSEKMVNFTWKECLCLGIHHIDLLGWLPWKQEMSLRAIWVYIFYPPGFLLLGVGLIFIEDDCSIDFSSYRISWVLLMSALFLFTDSSFPAECLPHFLPLLYIYWQALITERGMRYTREWGNVRLWSPCHQVVAHTPLPPGIWCAGFDRWSFFQLNEQKSSQFSRKTVDLHHTTGPLTGYIPSHLTCITGSVSFHIEKWQLVLQYMTRLAMFTLICIWL